MRSKTINTFLVNLGCPKNQVDGEVMASALLRGGFLPVSSPEKADIIIVNTCAFIRPAVEESIEAILELSTYKKRKCRILVVAGCLPRRYGKPLKEALPEVDLFLGPGEIPHLVSHLNGLLAGETGNFFASVPRYLMHYTDRSLAPAAPFAYLKIADGCSNFCTYCLIPRIRGKKRSRPPEDIVKEAAMLSRSGVKEIILVAQDTTAYGTDLAGRPTLEGLLKDICAVAANARIRLLYTHPGHIKESLLHLMAEEKRICPYLDMPIQHINDSILAAMNRRYRRKHVENIITMARTIVPDIALRTTIIVGFPGETEKRFQELLDFIRMTRFDHLGVFPFYPEEGTRAAKLTMTYIPKRWKEERLQIMMEEQAIISRELNEKRIGTRQEILIEGASGRTDFPYQGRTRGQAPDIDGITYVRGKGLKTGQVVEGVIVKADTYDLYATVS